MLWRKNNNNTYICICAQNLCTYYNTFNIFYTVCITILYYVLVELLLTCVRSKVVQEYYFSPHLVVSESTYRNLCAVYIVHTCVVHTHTHTHICSLPSAWAAASLERARPDYPTANSYTIAATLRWFTIYQPGSHVRMDVCTF